MFRSVIGLDYISSAFKIVIDSSKHLLLLGILTPIIFFGLIFLQVILVAGNDLEFQLSILTSRDLILLAILSFSLSFLVVLQLLIFKKTTKTSASSTTQGLAGGTSGVVAAIFGTAACSSCVAALFGFLGFGAVLFLLDMQWIIVAISILFVLGSIYFASKTLVKGCEDCDIK